jgi:hypothetical protein
MLTAPKRILLLLVTPSLLLLLQATVLAAVLLMSPLVAVVLGLNVWLEGSRAARPGHTGEAQGYGFKRCSQGSLVTVGLGLNLELRKWLEAARLALGFWA